MKKFFQKLDLYFTEHPLLFWSIAIAVAALLVTTCAAAILFSIYCPALLAIGIGAWSLFGNILPLGAVAAFMGFAFLETGVLITRAVSSPFDYFDVGLANESKMPESTSPKQTESASASPIAEPSGSYGPLFKEEPKEPIVANLVTTTNQP